MDNQELIKILTEIRDDVKSLKNTTNQLKMDVEEIRTAQITQEGRHTVMEKELQAMTEKISRLEKASMSSNIVLYKVEDSDEKNKDLLATVMEIVHNANVNIPEICIASVYRIGKQPGRRPILIKFIAPRWKSAFFENAKNFQKLNVSFANDLPREERQHRKRLLKARFLLRGKGEQPVIKKDNIFLNNRPVTPRELEDIPGEQVEGDLPPDHAINFGEAVNTVKPKKNRPRKTSAGSSTDTSLDQFVTRTPRTTRLQSSRK